jgi:hypothetical protein
VHGTEHVVGLTGHLAVLQPAGLPAIGENPAHPLRQRLVREGDAPAHHHHQVKSEGQEQHRRDAILDADHLVIGGKNVLPEESGVVVVIVVMGGVSAHGSGVRRWLIQNGK